MQAVAGKARARAEVKAVSEIAPSVAAKFCSSARRGPG